MKNVRILRCKEVKFGGNILAACQERFSALDFHIEVTDGPDKNPHLTVYVQETDDTAVNGEVMRAFAAGCLYALRTL